MVRQIAFFGILALIPVWGFAQQDTTGRDRKTHPERGQLPDSRALGKLDPPESTDWPRSPGSLLIVRIPPGNPDRMPVWKPDPGVTYFMLVKPVGTERELAGLPERVPMKPVPQKDPARIRFPDKQLRGAHR